MPRSPKHILVIRLSAMGDVAMTVPILRALSQQYPELKITVLTKGHFEPFFRDLKNVFVFEADIKGKHKGILGLYRLSRELSKLDIDSVADLHNVIRSNILKALISRPFFQIDKGRADKKALISGQKFEQLKTTHQRYVDVFNDLGLKVSLDNPIFPARKKLNDNTLSLTGSKNAKWIGIAPFAAYKSKMYPLPQMKKVIENLSKKYKVFLFGGGEKEVAVLTKIEKENTNVINLAGQLNLKEELDVISNLDVMLSMDSGNGHLAAMLGIKVVTIWGVTHPYTGFTPFNQPESHQLLANRNDFPLIPTSIYGNTYPEGYEVCAGSISVDVVVDKVKSIA